MPTANGHAVYITQIEDGSFLAASITSPRFCLSAPTLVEAKVKAARALAFYNESRGMGAAPRHREARVFAPVYQRELLCA